MKSCNGVLSAMFLEQFMVVSYSRRDNPLPWHKCKETRPIRSSKVRDAFRWREDEGRSSASKPIYHAAKSIDLDMSQ